MGYLTLRHRLLSQKLSIVSRVAHDPLPGGLKQSHPHALTEGQRERQPCNCVYQANLFITTQVHRAQPNCGNQLFHDTASIVVGAAGCEEVRRYPSNSGLAKFSQLIELKAETRARGVCCWKVAKLFRGPPPKRFAASIMMRPSS